MRRRRLSRTLVVVPLLAALSAPAVVITADVASWGQTGTGASADGWVVTALKPYKEKGGVTFDAVDDCARSPLYCGAVTQVVAVVSSSQETMTRWLTVIPENAEAGERQLTASAAYAEQRVAWPETAAVRQFRFQIKGSNVGNWHVKSVAVYLDAIEPPQPHPTEARHADALPLRWTPDARAVSNEVEVGAVVVEPPAYQVQEAWNFTTLTNASGTTVDFAKLNPPPGLSDVTGHDLCLQGLAGGHLQVGKSDVAGRMRLPLRPAASERTALLRLFQHAYDTPGDAMVQAVDRDGATNELAKVRMTLAPHTHAVSVPDAAVSLILKSGAKHRIRVEDVAIVTDYVPGSCTTNRVAWRFTRKCALTVAGLWPGEWVWRVRSFDAARQPSGWSPWQSVALDAMGRPYTRPGLAVLIR